MHIIAENSERSTIERTRTEVERWRPTFWYLSQTEVHVYALSIGASVLLSFFPFCNVMLSFCRNVLHWRAAEEATAKTAREKREKEETEATKVKETNLKAEEKIEKESGVTVASEQATNTC